jgi:hypothetical protein
MSEAASAAEASALLAALHAEDRREHAAAPPVGTSEYRSLRDPSLTPVGTYERISRCGALQRLAISRKAVGTRLWN